MAVTALLYHFSALKDPGKAWKVFYPLHEVLLIVLSAAMAGAEDFVETERWAKHKISFLRPIALLRINRKTHRGREPHPRPEPKPSHNFRRLAPTWLALTCCTFHMEIAEGRQQ